MGESADTAAIGNEPWVYGPEAEQIVRRYARLRYRLLPYLYSYAHTSWQTGIPMMRALPLEFPDDERTWACDYQYMLGREVMVAPIVEPSQRDDLTATRSIYLPEGTWYDYWTDRVYRGPGEISFQAAFDVLPVFVRAGSVIPGGPDMDYIDGPADPELVIDVYGGAGSSFDLYEDDGVSTDYQTGAFAHTRILHSEARQAGRSTTTLLVSPPEGRYRGMPVERVLTFRFHGLRGRVRAWVNGDGVVTTSGGWEGAFHIGPMRATGPVKAVVQWGE